MNQTPEQIARDAIDKQLTACGWVIQNKNEINLSAGTGVAVREYQTDIGPADYVLFADKKPVGITETKRVEEGIRLTMEEFGEENKFCKKITYQSKEDPKTILSQFRNDYYPRIAVTVDMIATGTDIRPLGVLVFMRDVKSRSYYEQMKGRGTRTF